MLRRAPAANSWSTVSGAGCHVVLEIAVLAALWGCSRPHALIGRAAPDFVLTDTEGRRVYLNGCVDRVVMLNFWSVHCAPCLREMPVLQKLSEHYPESDVLVVGICTDAPEASYVESMTGGMGIRYPILLDTKRVSRMYGVGALPATFILSRGGTVRFQSTGFDRGSEERYRAAVDGLLREKAE